MPQPEKEEGCIRSAITRAGARGKRDAGDQRVAGVGGAHPAGALLAVERQHVGAERLVPEALVEAGAELGGAAGHRRHLLVAALEAAGDGGGGAPGAVGVGLHLHQRHRAAGEGAVGVEDRVVAVLPALVDQAFGVLPAVLDEAVAVAVAVDLEPGERRLDVGPELEHGGEIAGAVEIGAGEDDEERRGVDAAVVAAEGDLRAARPSRRSASRAGSCPARRRRRRRPRWPGWRRGGAARRGRSAGRARGSAAR